MAEQKGGTEDVEESHGEFLGLPNIDDSGIESGEDLKGINPEVMKEVEEALVRLECILPGLDSNRREAVSKLIVSLQSCLRFPPKRRVTIGVSAEELAAARRWFIPPLERNIVEHVNYQPILQRPGYLMEPAPQNAILSYIHQPERISDSGSLQDYDPSLRLFTTEQTVQIAIHKAAIKKQISIEGKRRESSDDGDVSSAEESSEINKYNEVTSAQRLLQIATDSVKKNPSAARFHNRSSKKLKMKRANTIDIPKPANFYEYSSGDEYGASADEVNVNVERKHSNKEIKFLPPTFEPKTENDLKFLAFLKQVNENQPKLQTYNPSARGGKHWNNRFSSIKTAFENTEKPKSSVPSPAKMFWQNSEAKQSNNYKDNYKNKLPWTVKTSDDGIVVGSLTVAKPGLVNNFNHAPISAFKPIEKKPVSTVSGTVKQIAAQKFSVNDSETEKRQEKVPKKQGNLNHPPSNYIPDIKQNTNKTQINSSSSAFKKYISSYQSNNSPEKSHLQFTPYININNSRSTNSSELNDKKNTGISKYTPFQNKHQSSNFQMNTKPLQQHKTSLPSTHSYVSKTKEKTLAAKQQFMTEGANSPQQNSILNPLNNNNFHTNSYQKEGHIIDSKEIVDQSSIYSLNPGNNCFHNNNFMPKKSGYQSPQPFGSSQSNHYQSSKFIKGPEKSLDHLSSIAKSQSVTLSKDVSHSHYSSPIYSNSSLEENFEYSPNLHVAKSNVMLDSNSSLRPKDKFKDFNDHGFSKYSQVSKQNETIYQQNTSLDSTVNHNKPYTAYVYSSNNLVNSTNTFQQSSNEHNANIECSNYMIETINSTPPVINEEQTLLSSPYNLSLSSSLERISPNRLSTAKGDDQYLSPFLTVSPFLRIDDDESPWGNVNNGDYSPLEEKAVSRVMGQAQCQQAVTVNNRTRRRFDLDLESELKLQVKQSAQKKSLSPSFPNVIQKSESWHQMVKEQMQQAKQAPPLPKITKAKSSHTLALPKQFEAALPLETLTQKKITVSQYLSKQSKLGKNIKTNPKYKSTNTINMQEYEDLDDVDEVFESIFQESNKKRNSK